MKTKYQIDFKINGRKQRWIRFGTNTLRTLKLVIAAIKKEWPNKKLHDLTITVEV